MIKIVCITAGTKDLPTQKLYATHKEAEQAWDEAFDPDSPSSLLHQPHDGALLMLDHDGSLARFRAY